MRKFINRYPLVMAAVIAFILGFFYSPWQWKGVEVNDLEQIIYSGTGELVWILYDYWSMYELGQLPVEEMIYIMFFVFTVYSCMVFVKNSFMEQHHLDGNRLVNDYLFDIIFSYATAVLVYHITPVFIELIRPKLGDGTSAFETITLITLMVVALPCWIRFCLFGFAYAYLGNYVIELMNRVSFSTFPMNLISPLLTGVTAFLAGLVIDAAITLITRAIFWKLRDHFEYGKLGWLATLLYKMV